MKKIKRLEEEVKIDERKDTISWDTFYDYISENIDDYTGERLSLTDLVDIFNMIKELEEG